MQAPPSDLTRTFLVVLIIAALIAGSLWTLLPFLGALLWAATIVVATWPLMLSIERLGRGRRSLATAVMTIVMLAIFIVPFGLIAGVILDTAMGGVQVTSAATSEGLGPPPAWVSGLPWVGARLTAKWQELATAGPGALTEAWRPYARSTASWALAVSGGVGTIVVHFLMTMVIAAILYSNGEAAANGVLAFARRISQERGERMVRLAGQAVRGVALGVVITALVQSFIAGFGLWLSGVPHSGLLLAVMLVLSVAQLGPLPVLVPAIIWLFWSGNVVWGSVLIVFAVVVAVLDNVLKPVLIRRGVDLPLLLIMAGVIGGLISFGVVGLFIGPVILAVTYTLVESWVREDQTASR